MKILIQYMYSGEATVTNDQLEGVLKAGDILRVRGLWRSNSGSSKKENIQSNNQKIERDKREPSQLTGQIQKIKLIQPTGEKVAESREQQATTACQNNVQSSKSMERKSTEKIEEKANESEGKKILEENKNNEQNKNKENLETNSKKKKTSSDSESNKSKSEGGENVRQPFRLSCSEKNEAREEKEAIHSKDSFRRLTSSFCFLSRLN